MIFTAPSPPWTNRRDNFKRMMPERGNQRILCSAMKSDLRTRNVKRFPRATIQDAVKA